MSSRRFSISYDLRKPGRDYDPLWQELDRIGAKRALQSHWLVRLEPTTAKALRDSLFRFLDANDGVFVISHDDGSSAWRNLKDINPRTV